MNVRNTAPGRGDLEKIAELAAQADDQVVKQHTVSRALLREFAAPANRGCGWHVQPYDLNHPERRLKTRTPRGVGRIENFVSYASASLEALWGEVEQDLPDVFTAAKRGEALEDPHPRRVLQDLIALHYVRSQHYREVFHRVFAETYQEQLSWLLTEGRPLLERASVERTGLHTAGPQGLQLRADEVLGLTVGAYRNGALLRVRIEDSFAKTRQFVARMGLEILEAQESEFLIGDNPALTVRYEGNQLRYSMALGDAHSAVLPIGPRHMIALAATDAYGRIPAALVDRMNVLQIKAARQYVYTRPHSPLAALISEVAPQWIKEHPQP
ncbi:DUF4238 domain-containing protein [Streptomyces sp. NBC_00258]|uniref:DUF4238 domain-containing protein n=1 Tax=Streptomyces sp. NBC_00258 TaxID=2903642 RepID=UPI002E2C0E99|nr:DUF4238 domain-containing protein [Streptomyces sp. NBC_00258]